MAERLNKGAMRPRLHPLKAKRRWPPILVAALVGAAMPPVLVRVLHAPQIVLASIAAAATLALVAWLVVAKLAGS